MAKPLFYPDQKVILKKNGHYWSGIVQFFYYDSSRDTTTYQIITNAESDLAWLDEEVKVKVYPDTDIFGPITKQIP